MFQQPIDFRDESEALYTLLRDKPDEVFARPTQFKDWTIDDIIGHLHMWNRAADLSLRDNEGFMTFYAEISENMEGGGLRAFEKRWRDGLKGHNLLDAWRAFYRDMTDHFLTADPKMRVKWAGPDMSVRSSITARLMETWAHGQAVYDILGVVRQDTDRIKNIAVLGINTFGWTFVNRGLKTPDDMPYVRLTAPSGDIWEWNDPANQNRVEGPASEFCQVVTQTRALADTRLTTEGEVAQRWMGMAQCFAGPPEDPPAQGVRRMVTS